MGLYGTCMLGVQVMLRILLLLNVADMDCLL